MRYTEGMHWELWSVPTANLIATFTTEADGFALVRELLGKGWQSDELSLMVEDEAVPVENLPPALSGAELARRADQARTGPIRRTA